MNELKISRNLSLPLNAVTQTFGFIGRKGGGKTYAAGKVVEVLLEEDAQVVILDPVGNWYGLRMAADGKGKGFNIPIFGGQHGDIPLQPDSGALIADLIVDKNIPAVIDVSEFRKHQRKTFVTDFAEQLFHRKKSKRTPLLLVLEEAQVFAPQRISKGEERMLGAIEDIVRLGRNYGIGAAMISQRPQSINKEVLNQVECLLVFQINGSHERKAIEAWIVDKGLDVAEMVRELPSLSIGEAFVWSPQWLKVLKKIKISKKKTYDGSSTPKIGDKVTAPKTLTAVDLAEIKQAMESTIEKAKADDPKELRKQIKKLELALNKAQNLQPEINNVDVPVFSDEDRRYIAGMVAKCREHTDEVTGLLERFNDKLHPINILNRVPPQRMPVKNQVHVSFPKPVSENSEVTKPQQKILNAIAHLNSLGVAVPKKGTVAVLAGASPKSSAYTNNLSRLRVLGFINYAQNKCAALTETGRLLSDNRSDYGSIQDAWFSILSQPQQNILKVIIGAHPDSISKSDVAELAGASFTSSAFTNNLSRLRASYGVIDYPEPGYVIATDLLFP